MHLRSMETKISNKILSHERKLVTWFMMIAITSILKFNKKQ